MSNSDDYRAFGKSADVPENYVMPCCLEDPKRRVSVARIDGKLCAFDDLLPTDRSPLLSCRLIGTGILSPCDGLRFDLATGNASGGSASLPLRIYVVRDVDGTDSAMISGA